MHYLAHITLNTGNIARQQRSEVSATATTKLSEWIRNALDAGGTPLPIPGIGTGYEASAHVEDGALVVIVYTPKPQVGRAVPLSLIGVATRSRHSAKLWDMLTSQPAVLPGLRQPGTPWCAALLYPTIQSHMGILEWLGDFERSVAWTWATRNPNLGAAT